MGLSLHYRRFFIITSQKYDISAKNGLATPQLYPILMLAMTSYHSQTLIYQGFTHKHLHLYSFTPQICALLYEYHSFSLFIYLYKYVYI